MNALDVTIGLVVGVLGTLWAQLLFDRAAGAAWRHVSGIYRRRRAARLVRPHFGASH